jgi:NADH-ubiquinone oxidoreductase chain 1
MKIKKKVFYINNIVYFLEVLLLVVPALLIVAFITIAERKTMASMQRRLGPNIVGYYGILQPFADALKLLIKEYISPTQANIILFFLGPIITLLFSLYGYIMIPYGIGISINDFNLGLLYMLAVSSLATYGILLAGWSANSKYAFLGSLRSTAQLISYELILSSSLLIIVLLSGTLNLSVVIEMQKAIWFIIPLFPLFIIFFIASVAETNRAPFDLAEAESELVSGFMTEHAAGIFVFFFLAEYASIVLMCILISIVLLGGYEIFTFIYYISYIFSILIFIISIIFNIIYYIILNIDSFLYYLIHLDYILILNQFTYNIIINNSINLYNIGILEYAYVENINIIIKQSIFFNNKLLYNYINTYILNIDNNIVLSLLYIITLATKSCMLIFTFIWVRASYPRIRFDQLMSYCWTKLLPIIIGIISLIPCIIYNLNIIPFNVWLL